MTYYPHCNHNIFIYIFFYISPFANLIKSDLIFQYRPFVQYSQVTSVSGEKKDKVEAAWPTEFLRSFRFGHGWPWLSIGQPMVTTGDPPWLPKFYLVSWRFQVLSTDKYSSKASPRSAPMACFVAFEIFEMKSMAANGWRRLGMAQVWKWFRELILMVSVS